MNPEEIREEKDKKIYELAFNMVPFLSEEVLAVEFGNLKDALSKAGAIFISEQYPKMIDLAYEMTKVIDNKRQRFNSAYLGWIKFELEAALLAEFDQDFKRNKNIIRYLIIKTVRDNTLAPKKIFSRESFRRPRTEKEEVHEEMDKEAVDKKIEELVV